MDGFQPTLFDNMALESGYAHLNSLRWKEALQYLHEAMEMPNGKAEFIETAIAACGFWKTKTQAFEAVGFQNTGENRDHLFAGFLEHLEEYGFGNDLKAFKKSLLRFLVRQIVLEQGIKPETFIRFFDLLIEMGMYEEAKSTARKFVAENPGEPWLLYYLAQAQFLDGEKTESRKNYFRAMLHFPGKGFEERIEDAELIGLSRLHGFEMAPAYALALGVYLPFIKVSGNIEPRGEKHAFALKSYSLLVEAEKALRAGKPCTEERKRLKDFNEGLYGVYFGRLGRNPKQKKVTKT